MATAKKSTVVPSTLQVKDISIEKGNIYQVSPKYDGSAPDGFKEHRTTKYLAEYGMNIEAVPFDKDMGVWDTGLYEESPCYAGMPADEVKRLVNTARQNIVEPLEKTLGKGKLDYKADNDYWLDYGVKLHRGRIFNTERPDHLLELFQVALHGKVSPKGQDSNPNYRYAQFSIENKEQAKTVQQENDSLDIQAAGMFYSLLNGDTELLSLVMNYVGIPIPGGKEMDKQLASSAFKMYVDDKKNAYQNKKNFISAVELGSEKNGYQELSFYQKVQKLVRTKKITKEREMYVIGEEQLGTNLKEVAKTIAKNPKLQELIVALEQ